MAKPQRVTYFRITLEDRPGALLGILQGLKSRNIGLTELWGEGTQGGQADLYVVARNPEKIREAWKSSNQMFEEGTGFFLKGADKTGVLLKPLDAIARAGVNIAASGAMAVSGNYGLFIRVGPADIDKAAQALGAK